MTFVAKRNAVIHIKPKFRMVLIWLDVMCMQFNTAFTAALTSSLISAYYGIGPLPMRPSAISASGLFTIVRMLLPGVSEPTFVGTRLATEFLLPVGCDWLIALLIKRFPTVNTLFRFPRFSPRVHPMFSAPILSAPIGAELRGLESGWDNLELATALNAFCSRRRLLHTSYYTRSKDQISSRTDRPDDILEILPVTNGLMGL